MKHLHLLLCAALFAVAAPAPTARADVAVSVNFFYDSLSPYGDWVYTNAYGYVWQPALAQNANWAPYSDGYWAYTDAGWTWISNEDFGWATYHYGRWVRMYNAWYWVPGYEWAPAWVSWRQANDCIGWAPLPPEARWSVNIGFNWWADSYYDIGPGCYNFVPMRSFGTRTSLRPFIFDRRQNVGYVDRSVNITNISFRQNVVNNIFVGGPDPARIDRFSSTPVRRLTLRQDDNDFRRDWLDNRNDRPRGLGSLSRIDRDQLIVAAPSIRREEKPGVPPRVRDRFDKPDIDRGWNAPGDRDAINRLRERQRVELTKAKSEAKPEKAPVFITGKTPPPPAGRPAVPEERRPTTRPEENTPRKTVPVPETKPRMNNEPAGRNQPERPSMPNRPEARPEPRFIPQPQRPQQVMPRPEMPRPSMPQQPQMRPAPEPRRPEAPRPMPEMRPQAPQGRPFTPPQGGPGRGGEHERGAGRGPGERPGR